ADRATGDERNGARPGAGPAAWCGGGLDRPPPDLFALVLGGRRWWTRPAASYGVSQPGFWLSTSGIRVICEHAEAAALRGLPVPGVQHQHGIQSNRYTGAFGAGQAADDDPGADLADGAGDHRRTGDQYLVNSYLTSGFSDL